MSIQVLLIGIAEGSLYGLLAAPIVLVYRLTGVANFAQGAMAAAGVFVLFSLHENGLSAPAALVGAVLFESALALLIFGALALQRRIGVVKQFDHITPLIVTLGAFEAINAGIVLYWGAVPRRLGVFESALSGVMRVGTNSIGVPRVMALVLLLVSGLLYGLTLRHTNMGLVLRATASDDTSAAVLGVNTPRVKAAVWIVAAVMGLVAGIMSSASFHLSPDIMTAMIIPAFVAAILGGMSSVLGAMAGGVLLGLVTAVSASLWGSNVSAAVALILAGIVLMLKPEGLFGARHLERA